LLLCSDQVELESGREVVPRNVAPVVPGPRRKWLNIVFDLNGVLCQCALKSYAANLQPYKLEDNVLCHRIPTIIGPKAVFARQNVGKFLRQVSEIANKVVVWTTMFKRNAEPIARHLFSGGKAPFDILGQEQCTKIEVAPGKFFHRGQKMHCMKVLSDTLMSNCSEDESFYAHNTLLIDDSPDKSICNFNGNAIFLDPWNHAKRRDDVLVGELLPWLKRLHSNCPQGELLEYVDDNRLGNKPLGCDDHHAKQIIEGMRESMEVMGTRFELPGIGLVIERPPRRK
jgi:NLI interacting factor-like phosphatase